MEFKHQSILEQRTYSLIYLHFELRWCEQYYFPDKHGIRALFQEPNDHCIIQEVIPHLLLITCVLYFYDHEASFRG